MQKCKTCQSQMMVEALGEGKIRVVCPRCGMQEVKDDKGRSLLTDDRPVPGGRHLITG